MGNGSERGQILARMVTQIVLSNNGRVESPHDQTCCARTLRRRPSQISAILLKFMIDKYT